MYWKELNIARGLVKLAQPHYQLKLLQHSSKHSFFGDIPLGAKTSDYQLRVCLHMALVSSLRSLSLGALVSLSLVSLSFSLKFFLLLGNNVDGAG